MGRQATDIERLNTFMAAHPRITVLTGAGISDAAGIPTYRDRFGHWRHSEPIQHREFLTNPAIRQRYWARSLRGWPAVSKARPTDAHRALAHLERLGHIDTVITQNVDRLHQQAGSRSVIDLHGRLDRVLCLGCKTRYSRDEVQNWLQRDNERTGELSGTRPDGDADISPGAEEGFSVPGCGACGGTLMPEVVFFGANVPRERVDDCTAAIERSDALLAVGSSLQVFSGFRFCRLANSLGKPLVLLNPGATRADKMAQLKIEADCQDVLPGLSASDCSGGARNAFQ